MRTNQHFKFQDLNIDQLWELRKQIVLNSIFIQDYENDFEFEPESISNFFDGYIEYLYELANGEGLEDIEFSDLIDRYDNPDKLFEYYWGRDSEYLCSIQYDPEWDEEDDAEYERYWNGIDPDGHDPECR